MGQHQHYAGSVGVLVSSPQRVAMCANCKSQPQSVSGLVDVTEVSIQTDDVEHSAA